jgi:hypothetical protein
MIAVCELQCKGLSHEKVNSGFLYGLRLAFPDDRILFFAEPTHIEAIKYILKYDKVVLPNIEYFPIHFDDKININYVLKTYNLLKGLLSRLNNDNIEKLFFLSFNPIIISTLKFLIKTKKYKNLKFTCVLHGGFEEILPAIPNKILFNKIENIQSVIKFKELTFQKIKNFIKSIFNKIIKTSFNKISNLQTSIINKYFTYSKSLLLNPSKSFKYIALSHHIIPNLTSVNGIDKIQIYTVVLPTIFKQGNIDNLNNYVKFGIFGYGKSKILKIIAEKLMSKKIEKQYEIRIIGMDNSELSLYNQITCPSPGVRLSREDMEKHAEDIDMFLILYDESLYRVSCSGSIMESLSNQKPILHFNNDCINHFNNDSLPIGIKVNSIDEFVDAMVFGIENYDFFKDKLKVYQDNITILRDKYKIENSIIELKKSFTW